VTRREIEELKAAKQLRREAQLDVAMETFAAWVAGFRRGEEKDFLCYVLGISPTQYDRFKVAWKSIVDISIEIKKAKVE